MARGRHSQSQPLAPPVLSWLDKWMSDYLNNFVARALNLAPVVQPRLPSLFESPSTAPKISRPPSETETPGEDLVLPESNRPVPALAMPTQLAHTAARLVTADSPSVSNERKNAIAES